MNKKNIALVILLILIIAGAIVGYLRFRHSVLYVKTEDAYVKGDVYNISFKTSGRVKDVLIRDNVFVKKGDLLATLETDDYDLAVKNAESKLDEAKVQLTASLAHIEEVKANIKALESELELARIEKERAEALYKKESIPKQKYDQAITNERVLSSKLNALKKTLESVISQQKIAEEKVKNAEIGLMNARLIRSYCEVYSPVDGYVTKKNIQVGQVVQAGQVICAVVPLDPSSVYIEANYKETQLKRVRVGQRAYFYTDLDKSKVFEGYVESISPGTGVVFSLFPPENATGNWVKIVQRVPVKIKIKENQKGLEILRLGLSVTCIVDTTSKNENK